MMRSKHRYIFSLLLISLFALPVFFQNYSMLTLAREIESNAITHILFLPIVNTPPRSTTERVSVATGGAEGNGKSRYPSISADGRFIAFSSDATNLVANDTNGASDIFVHDRQSGETTRVSVSSNGTQGNYGSSDHSISADGRFIIFQSYATNLVANDTNAKSNIFVHDRQTGETTRTSIDASGSPSNLALSGDGNIVVYQAISPDSNGNSQIFAHNLQTSVTTLVSKDNSDTPCNDRAIYPFVSENGRFVTFQSPATDLVNGDTNDEWDVFIHDLQTGVTSLASVKSDGTQGNGNSVTSSVSADGRFVAFASYATNFVNGDLNNGWDIFVYDRQIGETIKVPLLTPGTINATPVISANGRAVAFTTWFDDQVDGDAYVYDLDSGKFELLSVTTSGNLSRAYSAQTVLSADGSIIAFYSSATTLVNGDTNNTGDVFVRTIVSK